MCCDPGSSGASVLGVFNTDDDCAISIEEVRQSALLMNLFAPDLDLYNGAIFDPEGDGTNDAVSIGVKFTAANAFFLPPP